MVLLFLIILSMTSSFNGKANRLGTRQPSFTFLHVHTLDSKNSCSMIYIGEVLRFIYSYLNRTNKILVLAHKMRNLQGIGNKQHGNVISFKFTLTHSCEN